MVTCEHRENVNNGAERVCVMSQHAYVLAEAIFAQRGRTSLAALRGAFSLYKAVHIALLNVICPVMLRLAEKSSSSVRKRPSSSDSYEWQ